MESSGSALVDLRAAGRSADVSATISAPTRIASRADRAEASPTLTASAGVAPLRTASLIAAPSCSESQISPTLNGPNDGLCVPERFNLNPALSARRPICPTNDESVLPSGDTDETESPLGASRITRSGCTEANARARPALLGYCCVTNARMTLP